MRNTRDLLNQQISQLAIDACRKLGSKETKRFFKECPTIERNYKTITRKRRSKKSSLGKYLKSGQPKEVWEVDGEIFEKLWARIKAYAYTSAYESITRHGELSRYTYDEVDDLVSEIKVKMYNCLRFHGPTPNDCGFSKKIAVITANTLWNANMERTGVRKRVVVTNRQKGPYQKNFIEYPKMEHISKIENADKLFVSDDKAERDKIELLATVPSNLRKAVELILGGGFKRDAARICGLRVDQLDYRLREVFSDLREAI
jgi:DNA-directed RNA polymerase specialized sigma24 family protein